MYDDPILFSPARYWTDQPTLFSEIDASLTAADLEDSLSLRYAFALGEGLAHHRIGSEADCRHPELMRGFADQGA